MEHLTYEPQATLAAPPPDAEPAHLVEAVRKLVEDTGSEVLRREWRRLGARSREPHFSVAVVGEFSRGKSTLVNRLLGVDLLPVGPVPTTALLTRVAYAPEASLVGILPDGRREDLGTGPEAWEKAAAESRWAALEVAVPNQWLRDSGLQLLDTPGAGDLGEERMEEVIDAISVCEATVVVISATMALSLTERSFLEQHILARSVPRVLAVLTRLDEVPPGERTLVINHVRDRLATIHPDIAFAVSHAEPVLPPDSGVEIAGPAAIADKLLSWAAGPERQDRARRQLNSNLARVLALVEVDLAARRAAAGLAVEERRRKAEAERQELDRMRLDWEDLRLGLRARNEALLGWVEEQLAAAERSVSGRLGHELQQAPDARLWCRQELPFRLRQELGAVARAVGESLQHQMTADMGWLRQEVKARFERRLDAVCVEPLLGFTEEVDPETGDARDLGSLRLMTRVGAGVAGILAYALYGPLGIAAGVGAGLVGEYLINRLDETQREALVRVLSMAIDKAFKRGRDLAVARLRSAYTSILADAVRQEEIWYEARREALGRSMPSEASEPEHIEASFAELRRFQSLLANEQEDQR